MQVDHNAIHIGRRMKYGVFDLFSDSVALEHCLRRVDLDCDIP